VLMSIGWLYQRLLFPRQRQGQPLESQPASS
jgi:hypothetical protein